MSRGLSNLIAQAYECAEDNTLWPEFMSGYARLVNANSTILIAHDRSKSVPEVLGALNIDLPYQRKYGNHYASRDVYIQRAHEHPQGVVIPGHMVCPEDELERSEYYQDYLRPQQIYHSLGAVLATPSGFANIGATRPRGAPRFDTKTVAAAQRLILHVGRALRLSDRLRAAEHRLAAGEVLYRLAVPVITFDHLGNVTFANCAAERILRQQDGLVLWHGQLRAAVAGETAALAHLITSAIVITEERSDTAGGTILITRKSGRRSYILSVYPLRCTALPCREARAVALLTDPEATPPPLLPRLVALFGLTPAEARIAERVMNGESLEQAVQALHVSIETARTHLKRVLSKTGTRRQAELVRILLQIAQAAAFDPCEVSRPE